MRKIINRKFIIVFFTLIFFITIICYFQFYKNARNKETVFNFSKNSGYELDKDFNEGAFNNLTKDLKSDNLILSLYDDNLEENYKIDFQILKYLNAKSGVKSYITDLTYSDAYVVNQYLKTGDENILKELFKVNDWDQKFNNDFYDEIVNIYNYNKSISKNKIEVIGVFPEISTGSISIAIKCMMPNYEPPENISYYINSFKGNIQGVDSKDAIFTFSQKFSENMKNNYSQYENYFGASFKDFKIVADNLFKCVERGKLNSTTDFYSFVHSDISESLKKIQLTGKSEKYYGAFRPIYYFGNTSEETYIPSIISNSTKCKYTTVRFTDNNISPINGENNKVLFNNIQGNAAFMKIDKSNSSVELKKNNYLIYVKNSNMAINASTEERDELVGYLNKNKASLGDNNKTNMNGLSLIDKDISKYDVFITGEDHAVKINTDIQLAFLKYLNKKANIKYFLCEVGYGEGRMINNYLKTGDKSILDQIMNSSYGSPSYNADYVRLWTELYEYNKTLPNEDKIQVIGMDVDHQINLAISYLRTLIPKEQPSLKISNCIDKANTCILRGNGFDNISNTYTEIIKNINENIKIYQTYLGDNFFDFKLTCENILNAALFYGKKDYAFRDKCMYNNFVQIYDHFPKGKYYGEWGSAHTILNTDECSGVKGNNMATLMSAENSPVYNKVLSIPIMYSNCYYLNNGVKSLVYTNFKNDEGLGLLSQDEVQLFKLNGENSPFNKKLYLVNGDKGVTTDYFQYAIFVRNSPASSPYTGIK